MSSARSFLLWFKYLPFGVGIAVLVVSGGYLINELSDLGSLSTLSLTDIVTFIAIFSASISGIVLVTSFPNPFKVSFPNSFKMKFRRIGQIRTIKPTYGFGSLLAVGLGATLGSPLFILIPLNILQFEAVSLGSLVIASVLSILMAKVYANMYLQSLKEGLDAVGGPSFTKVACGTHSVRYFISRLSMWVANTALAAYSKIVFIVFDFELMPGVLKGFGITGLLSDLIIWLITGLFIGWTVLNALFEQRLLKLIGYLQIAMTSILVVILVYQSYIFGSSSGWNILGVFSYSGSGNWLLALVINTGYLYLLFFGFQEIQALEHDVHEVSSIPIISWIKRDYKMAKAKYLGAAMILSVLIAAAINILYGLAVYSLHPIYATLLQSQIPAMYLANAFGPVQELLIAVAFLVATITTFVPAFLAASRHLGALAEDGFMPLSVSNLSYVFTLIAIFILAVGDQNFLIEITDFLVLASLGLITMSAIWMRKRPPFSFDRSDALPLGVGISCFIAGGAIYAISPSVVIFGMIYVAAAYLIYDIYELGAIGSQLFLGVFDLLVYIALRMYPHTFATQSFFLFEWLKIPAGDTSLLSIFLIVSSLFLFANLSIEIYLRRNRAKLQVVASPVSG
ncbi:MAG: hypothetical protein ACRECH_10570 [Nitrososphaerales archaeon]